MNRFPTAPICRYSRIKYTQKALKQPCRSLSRASTLYYNATLASRTSYQTNWNNHDEFFKFTRGRFLINEAEILRMREIQFDMNSLAQIAAESVGATHCTSIQKYPDGMFNKTFLMSMDNGHEVVAKVPNMNAGIPHLTTASEFATMDFARNVLETPAPRVYTWNSHAQSHPVGAEFIIMEKAAGVPLSHVWETLKLPQKLQVLLAMIRLQKKWLSVSFSHYGSLYYAKDIQASPPEDTHYIKNGKAIKDPQFAIGPTTGRDWCDASRSLLGIDRGPFMQAVGTRETKAIQSLHPSKQLALFCGPKLYQPCPQSKLIALSHYLEILESLIPKDTALITPHLWHNDLHNDNIFIDPQNPESITSIIDWQSTHISPLFTHTPDPAFLDWGDGLEPETLDLLPRPNLSGLTPQEIAAAVREYTTQNLFIGWRKLTRAKNPALHQAIEFRKTPAYGLIFLAHRMFEYGEAHFMSLLVDMKDH
ncbi:phosphotransferase enzyme family protein [Aspergillus eucalypticola CBS 122712]|uniref:Altered inheritance of mitochondria protein 9, mitochondrial n=1 Tax=Aspergillus eucalypticola (strain CBS 122712 / IBT 29274) TaxID=1448314 RepID=A0A317VA10_ASPEC|nr:phosphotransferase enzyme family protein [Aspergillus eucalypticola CBS 122712]PWY70131.1 phosphotransferase enzyme family protein [Aspergillus eucalypticola CBS 122712]